MTLPNATDFGRGTAQVVDTTQPLNTFMKLRQEKMIKDEQDQRAVSSMMTQLNSEYGKLRQTDRDQYLQKYNRWKQINIQNPDLYRNPLKKPELFNEAERLRIEMQEDANDSKLHTQNLAEMVKMYSKPENQHKFTPNSVAMFDQAMKLPSRAFREKYGSAPSATMFEYTPTAPDPVKYGAEIDAYTSRDGGFEDKLTVTRNDKDKNIPIGYQMTRIDRHYNPQKLSEFGEMDYLKNGKFYDYTFTEDKDKVASIQEELNTKLGNKSFEIKKPSDLARAYAITNFSVKQGTPREEQDKNYWDAKDEKDKAAARAESRAFRLTLANMAKGGNEKEAGNTFLKLATSAIGSGDEEKIQDILSSLEMGGKYINVKAKKVGDDVVVTYQTPAGVDAEGGSVGGQTFERRLKNDANLGNQLKGLYQGLTGSDAKFERSEIPQPDKPKPKTYQYKGRTYTEDKLIKAAKESRMTVEEYKKELGIK